MQQQQKGMWLPLMASVGVGAATYYNMTKNGQGMGQTMQQMVPFVAGMRGQNTQQSVGQPTNAQQGAQQQNKQQNAGQTINAQQGAQ